MTKDGTPRGHGPVRRIRHMGKVLLGREMLHVRDLSCPVAWYGSEYGGWYVCPEYLAANAVVYAFGIGEDISFEFDLAAAHRVEIHSFDPTPRSLAWIAQQRSIPESVTVHPWGLMDVDDVVHLHAPRLADHVSHSVVADDADVAGGFDAPVFRLDTLRRRLGHEGTLDLVKMDIEGAEYRVVSDLAHSDLPLPRQLLVEFHHGHRGLRVRHTREAVGELRRLGYRLAAVSPRGRELTFLHRSVL